MFSSNLQSISRARAISGEIAEADEVEVLLSGDDGEDDSGSLKGWLRDLISQSGAGNAYFKKLCVYSVLTAGFLLFLAFITQKLWLFAFSAIAPLISVFLLKRKAFKRAENFEKDYTALLVSLASAIRSGIDPIVALIQSEHIFKTDSEVTKAVSLFKIQIEKGMPEEAAILNFASDIRHPDIDLFRSAFILARREGSSIGECLHRLAKVTRQRQSFRRKIRAAVAMQKMSALGIAGCAIAIGVIQWSANSKAMMQAINHPMGFKILMTGVGLICAGLFWMLNMSKSKV